MTSLNIENQSIGSNYNERIDIVNSEGLPTGNSELKSIIHTKGYYHNTAHVWF